MNKTSSVFIIILFINLFFFSSKLGFTSSSSDCKLGFESASTDPNMSGVLGGVHDSAEGTQNSLEINDLAKFAVDEHNKKHNKKENSLLEFGRVLKAKEQVVAGTMHHLTVEVLEAGKKAVYDAKVWVKPWANFKQLEEFKQADGGNSGAACVTSSDLGVKQDR